MAVQLRLEAASAARPGATATAVAWIYNTGQVVQTYHLELVGRPESWATIDPSSVPLMPGDAGTATITFAVPPADQVPSGEIVWALRARAETDAADVALEEGTLIVEGETSLVCELLPATAAGRRRSRHRVVIENRGNATARLTIRGRDRNEVLEIRLADTELVIPPGGEREVGVQVTSHDRRRQHHPFVVEVEEVGGPVHRLDGGFDQQALPKAAWRVPALLALLVLAALLVNRTDEARSIRASTGDPAPTTSAPAPAAPPAGDAPRPDVPVSPSSTAGGPGPAPTSSGAGAGPAPVTTAVTPLPAPPLTTVVTVPASAPRPGPTTTSTLPFTSDKSPCGAQTTTAVGRRVQFCPLWRANVPVYDTADAGNGAKQIDTLYVGGTANWFVGQQWRSRYTSGPYTNRWWAFTLGDNGRWGWVPQVFFSGGANDERDAGLHLCGAQGNTCSP